MALTTTISGLSAVTAPNLSDAAVLPCDDALGNTLKATMAQIRTQVLTLGTTDANTLRTTILTLPAGSTTPQIGLTGSTTIANSATLVIAGMAFGFVKILSANGDSFALIMVDRGFGSVIVAQAGTLYSTTASTAGKVNVYVSGSTTVIENLSGVSDNFYIVAERFL